MPLVTRLTKRRFLTTLEGLQGGRLALTTPEGTVHRFGDSGSECDLVLKDWAVLPALSRRGNVGLGEAWVAGQWQTASLEGLLALAFRNSDQLSAWDKPGAMARLSMGLSFRTNGLRGATRNIGAQREVGNQFYQLWLDQGMSCSAALFAPRDDDLDRAQARKNDRILSLMSPGETVLDISCGWGGFAEAAANRGRRVTGITLSPNQKGYADARLDGRAEIRLQDYRRTGGRFDNIVSVEMIEAVGERFWPGYFAALKARLAEGGRAVLQAITVPDSEFSLYRKRADFMRQHRFPGGMLPCNAAIAREAARAGLVIANSFAFGQDYARTCRIWAQRMQAERARILGFGHDEAFLRRWQFYLEGCAAAFATGRTDVVQLQLAHAAPLH